MTIVAEQNAQVDTEEINSYGHLSGYSGKFNWSTDQIIEDFENQVRKLDSIFNCGTRFDTDWIIKKSSACPPWVEKFFAQISWQFIAPTYAEAVEKVLDAIKTTREKFYNHHEDQIVNEHLRQNIKTKAMFKILSDEQKNNDVLATPAQFGIRYQNLSVHHLLKVMRDSEYSLGACTVGIMILTHPERLSNNLDMGIKCAGDVFDFPESNICLDRSPYFEFHNNMLKFGSLDINHACNLCGSATGFVPNPEPFA